MLIKTIKCANIQKHSNWLSTATEKGCNTCLVSFFFLFWGTGLWVVVGGGSSFEIWKTFFSGFAFDQRLSLLLGQFHYSLIICCRCVAQSVSPHIVVGFAADVLLNQSPHIVFLQIYYWMCHCRLFVVGFAADVLLNQCHHIRLFFPSHFVADLLLDGWHYRLIFCCLCCRFWKVPTSVVA